MTLPPLGWPSLCLASRDVPALLAFCEALGFRQTGGNLEHGWVTLTSGATELALMGFLQADLITLRGADVPALAAAFTAAGLAPFHVPGHDPTATARVPGARPFDPTGWPADWLTGPDGAPLPTDGSGDLLLEDPDGHRVYFDTVPAERARALAGARFSSPDVDGTQAPGTPALGSLRVVRRSAAPLRTAAFYERLGLSATRTEDGVRLDGPFRLDLGPDLSDALRFEGGALEGERTDPDGRRWVFGRHAAPSA